jgi:hypothetical protein
MLVQPSGKVIGDAAVQGLVTAAEHIEQPAFLRHGQGMTVPAIVVD